MSEEARTMSGPATRPTNFMNTNGRVEPAELPEGFEYTPVKTPEFEPVVLPQYEARFVVERDSGEQIVSVTIVGSPRIVDQIMHASSDAFREEVET